MRNKIIKPIIFGFVAMIWMNGGTAWGQEPIQVIWNVNSNGFWHAGSNWAGGQPPSQLFHEAVIDRAGVNITVTHSQGSSTIWGIQCTETIDYAGGAMLLLGDSNIETVNMSGGSLSILPDLFINNCTMSDGAFTGGAGFSDVYISDFFVWTGGHVIPGLGNFTSAGTMTIAGSTNKEISNRFYNKGSAAWSGAGVIVLNENAVFTNSSSGVFDIQNDAPILVSQGDAYLINNGELRKTGGQTTIIQSRFTNEGLFLVQSGEIDFKTSYIQNAGETRMAGGILTNVGQSLQFFGGRLTGVGTVNSGVANGGAVEPGLGLGELDITGGFLQVVAGSVNIELGGAGIGQFDVLNIAGHADLGGNLNIILVNDFIPARTDTFAIMTYGSHQDQFAQTSAPILPGGWTMVPNYQPGGVILQVVPLSAQWVDFAYGGTELGTFDEPYGSMATAVAAVNPGDKLVIKTGVSNETPTISKAVTLESFGGSVVIGR